MMKSSACTSFRKCRPSTSHCRRLLQRSFLKARQAPRCRACAATWFLLAAPRATRGASARRPGGHCVITTHAAWMHARSTARAGGGAMYRSHHRCTIWGHLSQPCPIRAKLCCEGGFRGRPVCERASLRRSCSISTWARPDPPSWFRHLSAGKRQLTRDMYGAHQGEEWNRFLWEAATTYLWSCASQRSNGGACGSHIELHLGLPAPCAEVYLVASSSMEPYMLIDNLGSRKLHPQAGRNSNTQTPRPESCGADQACAANSTKHKSSLPNRYHATTKSSPAAKSVQVRSRNQRQPDATH